MTSVEPNELSNALLNLYSIGVDATYGLRLLDQVDAMPELIDLLAPHLDVADHYVKTQPNHSAETAVVALNASGTPLHTWGPSMQCLSVEEYRFVDPATRGAIADVIERLNLPGAANSAIVSLEQEQRQLLGLVLAIESVDLAHLENDMQALLENSRWLLLLPNRGLEDSSSFDYLDMLTPAERAVASAIAEGGQLSTIAAERSISINTLRTQLKSIYAKTGLNSQAQLIEAGRKFADVARIYVATDIGAPHVSRIDQLPDGRRIESLHYGKAEHFPVIALSGSMESAHLYPEQLAGLTNAGLRYIVWRRPGFGKSSVDPSSTPATIATDLGAWLGIHKLDRVILHGRANGANYALHAGALPGVSGIVLSNAVLGQELGSTRAPDLMIRAIQALFRNPKFVSPFGKVFAGALSQDAVARILRQTYAARDEDQWIVDDAEQFSRLLASAHYSLVHCTHGVAAEMAQGMAPEVELPDKPIAAIHSRCDSFYSIQQVAEQLSRANQHRLIELDSGGQLLAYTAWPQITAQLQLMRDQTA